jgi:hypothetical protein
MDPKFWNMKWQPKFLLFNNFPLYVTVSRDEVKKYFIYRYTDAKKKKESTHMHCFPSISNNQKIAFTNQKIALHTICSNKVEVNTL